MVVLPKCYPYYDSFVKNCSYAAVSLNADETKMRKGYFGMCTSANWEKASVFGFFNPEGSANQLMLLLNYYYCTFSLKLCSLTI